ncbi:MAG: membrane protein insertase YidC [Bacteroidota bacterium]|jgi:YidC/Oxa1 family membrane protein insertase|nr:MAG: membrane protein insertase YidC [Bacteroidota bacterium]
MDRNSAIGLTLIAVLLIVYFYLFSPTPPPPQTAETPAPGVVSTDSTVRQPQVPDSVLVAQYGEISEFMRGTPSITRVETEDLNIAFSSQGGVIQELELRNYKTYYKEPLILIRPNSTTFSLTTTHNGREIDLYDLFYDVQKERNGDSTILTYTLRLSDGTSLAHRYTIPDRGYRIRYELINNRFADAITGDQLTFRWDHTMFPTEKDLTDTRNNTTINYYSEIDGFDHLSERSDDSETLSDPIQWIAIKQKYFLASLIADKAFHNSVLSITSNPEDTSIVEKASVQLGIPKADLATGAARFTYYLGPNDYQEIGKVAEKFSRNVYLGFAPVYWVNKFVIFPVFHFLTLHIGNYGLIIIVLVLLLKLVLAPLSYRSYLSMAKMKVLKPELDAIKEKHGDDMTKVQQEQLKLYQQVGVNPISGCIPVLLQMPILFAMFYLFPASIELRQQPLLWAEDLSTYDSVIRFGFSIPMLGNHISLFTLLMTISTLIYTWQNNQLSSVQGPMKSMSYIMPLVFFFVLNSFSAGLTFYYLISNLVTFAQQAIIRRFVNEEKIKAILEENRKRNLGGGKKSKFMAKLEEAMKASEEARKASSSKPAAGGAAKQPKKKGKRK